MQSLASVPRTWFPSRGRRVDAQPGRRNPVPGFSTWKKVKDRYFSFVPDAHLRRFLAVHKATRILPEPGTETFTKEVADMPLSNWHEGTRRQSAARLPGN